MTLHPSVAIHLDEIRELAAKYGVEKLEIFGSAMTPEFDVDRSDVDFIVHYPEGYVFGAFGKNLLDFEAQLSDLLGRDAQVVMTKALAKPYFKSAADRTRTTIYVDRENESSAEGHSDALSVHH